MRKKENNKEKSLELKLINSSVMIDGIIIGLIFWFAQITEILNIFVFLVLGFLAFIAVYHFSWRTVIIDERGIKIRSIIPFVNPICISYMEFEKTKLTAYGFVIDFSNFRKKVKLDLIYPIWAEFLTINTPSEQIEEAVDLIYKYKEEKIDDEMPSFSLSSL